MKYQNIFASFSTDNIEKTEEFYGKILGLDIENQKEMGLKLKLSGGGSVFIYPKENHQAATFTVLNFVVENIDLAVDELRQNEIKMERYDMDGFKPDEKGIYRSNDPAQGPTIAWFKDPAGNVLSLIENTNNR